MKTSNIILAVMMIILFKMNGMSQNVMPNDKVTSIVTSLSEASKVSKNSYCKDVTLELKHNQIYCVAILEDGIIQDENSLKMQAATNQTMNNAKKLDLPEVSIVYVSK